MNLRRARTSITMGLTVALALGWGASMARTVGAEPQVITGATFEWSVNDESNTGAYDGSCNWMSAGESTGYAASFAATHGNATVLKLNAADEYVPISDYAARCLDKNGVRVTAGGGNRLGQKVRYTGGTGTADPVTGEVEIQWTGTFSNNYYDELTPFWFGDPKLTVGADGNGTVTATVGGYQSSIDNPDVRELMDPVPGVVIATLAGVGSANADGFVTTPVYQGVVYDNVDAPQIRAYAGWGSWPLPLVTVMSTLGSGGYFYTTGGAADIRKAPAPIVVGFGEGTAPATTTTTTTTRPPLVTTTTTTPPATTTTGAAATAATVPPMTSAEQPAGAAPQTIGGQQSSSSGSGSRAASSSRSNSSTNRSTATTRPSSASTGSVTTAAAPTPPPDSFGWVVDASQSGITLGAVPGDGTEVRFGGELGDVMVYDSRPGAPAWSISGQVSDFTGGLSGKHLGWTPRITLPGGGATAGAAVAPAKGNGLADPSVLASAPKGHPVGPTTIGAAVDLRVPSGTSASSYSATLTITALG